jgi:hypothetical protein
MPGNRRSGPRCHDPVSCSPRRRKTRALGIPLGRPSSVHHPANRSPAAREPDTRARQPPRMAGHHHQHRQLHRRPGLTKPNRHARLGRPGVTAPARPADTCVKQGSTGDRPAASRCPRSAGSGSSTPARCDRRPLSRHRRPCPQQLPHPGLHLIFHRSPPRTLIPRAHHRAQCLLHERLLHERLLHERLLHNCSSNSPSPERSA